MDKKIKPEELSGAHEWSKDEVRMFALKNSCPALYRFTTESERGALSWEEAMQAAAVYQAAQIKELEERLIKLHERTGLPIFLSRENT